MTRPVPSLSRRRFLRLTGGALAACSTTPLWLRVNPAHAGTVPPPGRKLIVVCLAGGNDGLNTVVPYATGAYYDARPTIAYRPGEVIALSGSAETGLHPSLVHTASLYEAGRVAIIQGVGYDDPDLSHFASMDIWESASPTHAASSGWLGRYLDRSERAGPVPAVAIGHTLPRTLIGAERSGLAVPSLRGFAFADGRDTDEASEPYRLHEAFRRFADAAFEGMPARALLDSQHRTVTAVRAVNQLGETQTRPPATLADRIAMAVTVLDSDLGCEVAFCTLGGFDHHAATRAGHPRLLSQLDEAILRFTEETAKTSRPADYLLMTFSEFGRRVAESGSAGTDHGTAAPLLVVGDAVAGGLHGAHPDLRPAGLDRHGNLIRTVEFREVYATVLDRWLGGPAAHEVLRTTAASGLHPVNFLA